MAGEGSAGDEAGGSPQADITRTRVAALRLENQEDLVERLEQVKKRIKEIRSKFDPQQEEIQLDADKVKQFWKQTGLLVEQHNEQLKPYWTQIEVAAEQRQQYHSQFEEQWDERIVLLKQQFDLLNQLTMLQPWETVSKKQKEQIEQLIEMYTRSNMELQERIELSKEENMQLDKQMEMIRQESVQLQKQIEMSTEKSFQPAPRSKNTLFMDEQQWDVRVVLLKQQYELLKQSTMLETWETALKKQKKQIEQLMGLFTHSNMQLQMRIELSKEENMQLHKQMEMIRQDSVQLQKQMEMSLEESGQPASRFKKTSFMDGQAE